MATKTSTTFEGRRYSGVLYAKEYGSTGNWQKLGNGASMTITTEIETDELLSTGHEDYGSVISKYISQKSTALAIELDSFNPDALARAFMGNLEFKTHSSQAISTSITVPADGGTIDLGYKNIDPESFTVDGGKEGFVLDAFAGLLEIVGDKWNVGDVVAIAGQTKQWQSSEIAALKKQQLVFELQLSGKDLISQKRGVLHIPHAVLASNASMDWFSKEWWKNGLEGSIIKDDGKENFTFIEEV